MVFSAIVSSCSFDSLYIAACVAQANFIYAVLRPHENAKMNEFRMHTAKGLYYCAIALAEMSALSNYPWLPQLLGGQGIMTAPLPANNFPSYPQPSDITMLHKIFYIQFIYHAIETVVSTLPGNRTKPEMFLHHSVTIVLLLASYLTEQFTQGTIILLLHNAPDVTVCATKAFHALNLALPTLTFFASMLSAWMYFRIYLLAMYSWNVLTNPGTPSNRVSGILLFSLVGLHAWWFYLFVKMAFRFATGSGSQTKDMSQKVKPPSPSKAEENKDHMASLTISKED